jgi:hypothetical protein
MMGLPDDIPRKLNVGCGQNVLKGYLNVDKNIERPIPFGVFPFDVDKGELLSLPHNHFEGILAEGCIGEFKTDLVEIMNQFWTLLAPFGLLEISVAVVDGGNMTPYCDPLARRYLASGWVDFFHEGGSMADYPLGFRGKFTLSSNEVSPLGVQRVSLIALEV